MGLFTTSTFDADVEKATNEKNESEEWSVILEVCDKIQDAPQHSKEYLKAIFKRLNHQDPHIVMQAISLLDACVNNCGKPFHLEVASRDFETEFRKLITKGQPRIVEKLKGLLKKWAEGDFKSDTQLTLIPSLYDKLIKEGIDFSQVDEPSKPKLNSQPKDPNAVSSQREVEDIAKAIELSLQDTTISATTKSSTSNSSSLYPSTSMAANSSSEKKVRALYDFEAVEENELTFFAGEIIHVLDDSDSSWWEGCNQRGKGLFPANFVTLNLSVEPENAKAEKKSVQFNETVEVKTVKPLQEIEIDEAKIDKLSYLLHEAHPEDDSKDSEHMLSLEATAKNKMKNLRSICKPEDIKIQKSLSSEVGADDTHEPQKKLFSAMSNMMEPGNLNRTSLCIQVGKQSSALEIELVTPPSQGESEQVSAEVVVPSKKQNGAIPPTLCDEKSAQFQRISEEIMRISEKIMELKPLNDFLNRPELQKNECDIFGNHISTQLKQLTAHSCILAQEEIQNILTKYRIADLRAESPASSSSRTQYVNLSDISKNHGVVQFLLSVALCQKHLDQDLHRTSVVSMIIYDS